MIKEQLKEAKSKLREYGVEPDDLVLLFVGPNEMIFGEEGANSKSLSDLVSPMMVINPRKITRIQMMSRETGAIHTELRFTDLDFIKTGRITAYHQGGFRIDWIDSDSRLDYLKSYIGYFESKRLKRAQDAGIVVPDGQTPESVNDILSKIKAR